MAVKKKSSKKTATKKRPVKKTAAKKAAPIRCGKWTAIHDFMPGKPPTLRVRGICITPKPGYRIRLVEAVPQGINPLILLLKKIVTPPKGVRPPKPTPVAVSFTKKTATKYTHVTILPDGTTIKVQNVS